MTPSEIQSDSYYSRRMSDGTLAYRVVRALFNGMVLYLPCDVDKRPKWVTNPPGSRYTTSPDFRLIKASTFARWAEETAGQEDHSTFKFFALLREVVRRKGTPLTQIRTADHGYYTGHQLTWGRRSSPEQDVMVYTDDTIAIATSLSNGAMWVERRENHNPVIYLDEKGVPYRVHGEYTELIDHVQDLLA